MADVHGMLADPQFQQLDRATQRQLLSEADPDFGKISDDDLTSFMADYSGGPKAFTPGFESKGLVGPKPPTTIEKASSFLRGGNPYQPKPMPESSWQNFGQTVAGDVLPPALAAFAPNWALAQAMPQIAGAVRHPIDTLRSFVSPDQEMPMSEQAGHIASLGLTGLLPGARNPAVGETIGAAQGPMLPEISTQVGRVAKATWAGTKAAAPYIMHGKTTIPGFIGYELAGPKGAILGGTLPAVPEFVRGFRESMYGPQEVFTGAGAKAGTPYVRFNPMEAPAEFQARGGGPPVRIPVPVDSEVPVAQGDVFTGAGAKRGTPKPVYRKLEPPPAESEFAARGGGPPIRTMHPTGGEEAPPAVPELAHPLKVGAPPKPKATKVEKPQTYAAPGVGRMRGGDAEAAQAAAAGEAEPINLGNLTPEQMDALARKTAQERGYGPLPATPQENIGVKVDIPPEHEHLRQHTETAAQKFHRNMVAKNQRMGKAMKDIGYRGKDWEDLPRAKQNEVLKAHGYEALSDAVPDSRIGREAQHVIKNISTEIDRLWDLEK